MGQCATLPYQSHQQHGRNKHSSSQYYANVAYKESPTSSVAYAMQQQCRQDGNGNLNQGGAQARQTDSETTCSANSANSNTPLIHNQQQESSGAHQHKYEPPPSSSAFDNNKSTNAVPPKSPASSSALVGKTKKRKSLSSNNNSNHSNTNAGAIVNMPVPIPEDNDANVSFEETMIPFVPDGATPKRCFRLNLGGEMLSPTAEYGRSRLINFSMSEDSSVVVGGMDMVAATAAIFRGLSVTSNGTVISTNGRVVNSARKSKNGKTSSSKNAVKADAAPKSRQAAKIDKLKELVEGTGSPKKPSTSSSTKKKDSNESSEVEEMDNSQMLSLVPIGEYNDMKHLVRDGARKLKAAEAGLCIEVEAMPQSPSRSNATSPMSGVVDPTAAQIKKENVYVGVPYGSPRGSRYTNNQSSPIVSTRDVKRNGSKSPPKLNHHPRDPPTSATPRSRHRSRFQAPQCSEGSDWSEALGFSQGLRSFWNCGNDMYGENSCASRRSSSQHQVYDHKGEVYKRAHEKNSNRGFPVPDVNMMIEDDRHDMPSSPRREDDGTRNQIDITMA